MRLALAIALFVSCLAAPSAAQTNQLTWDRFHDTIGPSHVVRLVLPDGTALQGRPLAVHADGMDIQITKTSAKGLHPKGKETLPRNALRVVEVRSPRSKGRLIGTLVPLAAGAALMASANACEGRSIGFGESCFYSMIATGGAIIGLGTPAGFFIGRSIDRRFVTYTIAAER